MASGVTEPRARPRSTRAPSGGKAISGPPPGSVPRARKARSGAGSAAVATVSAPGGGGGSGAGSGDEAGEGVEERRRGRLEAEGAGDRGAVGPAEPDADDVGAVEADRPGVAVAVAGAGLEGDAPRGAVRGRRRAAQDVGDVPGRHRVEHAGGGRRPTAGRFRNGDGGAALGDRGVERGRDPRASGRRRRGRWRGRGCRRAAARGAAPARAEAGDELRRADRVEERDRRQVARRLQRARAR